MDLALVVGILGIAVVDSINPSALIMAGYILTKAPASTKTTGILSYVTGIFVFYFLIGALILLGLGALLATLGPALESRPAYIIQALIGVVLFVWSLFPPRAKSEKHIPPGHFGSARLFLLGITITVVEFSTALPYLGAISLLQQAAYPFFNKIFLLAVYNVIFIAPPLILLLLYTFNKTQFTRWQEKRAAQKNKKPDDTMQWIVGILGVLLVLHALSELHIFT